MGASVHVNIPARAAHGQVISGCFLPIQGNISADRFHVHILGSLHRVLIGDRTGAYRLLCHRSVSRQIALNKDVTLLRKGNGTGLSLFACFGCNIRSHRQSALVQILQFHIAVNRIIYSCIQVVPPMGVHRYAAVNGRFFHGVAIIGDYIALFVCFIPFHAIGCKVPEHISLVGQGNGVPAGSGNRRSRQHTIFRLNNGTLFRCQIDSTASVIRRNSVLTNFVLVRNRQFTCFHGAVQRYTFIAGNCDRPFIANRSNGRVFTYCCHFSGNNTDIAIPGLHRSADFRIVFRINTNIACPCNHFAINLCISSCIDADSARIGIHSVHFITDSCFGACINGNIAIRGFYRSIHRNVLHRFQHHVATSVNLAVDTILRSVIKPD